ncbi:hypothetical protein IEN85_08745 [Pelagicoccus sp. NFK12]|uniref:Uncharacterized protein n=1 Tax=Pelagicoccus enzymogenes TaxID=2773457 RepID=A0A927IGW1_9BACT|nr:hypothetical protein [Pelagicoccus enzymogenes]MBD5779581.1 hypothetical protein [Pelagicoccus enzymogenes]
MQTPNTFSSKAWLLDGPVHSLPGILHLEDGTLSYLILEQGTFSETRLKELLETHGTNSSESDSIFPIQLFSVTLDTINRFHIPWYYFGAGGKLSFAKHQLRFSFVKPQNTVEPTYYSESFMEWRGGKGQEEVNILEGKASGKRWKALLAKP